MPKYRAALVALGVIAMMVLSVALPWKVSLSQPGTTQASLVRGSIVASVGGHSELGQGAPPTEEIYLPNVRVVLRDLATQRRSEPVLTDLSGRFLAQVVGPGRFQACWEAKGFGSGCIDQVFSIGRSHHHIDRLRIPIPREPGAVALYGRVRLADGSSARMLEPLANVNTFARVSLLDAGGTPLHELPVNNFDQYLLPQVPLRTGLQLRVSAEGASSTQALELSNAMVPTQRLNLEVRNTPPRIEPLVALDAGGVRVSGAAAPGSTVKLVTRVSDRDGDKLRFAWQVTGGVLSAATDAEPSWQLPATGGDQAATLIAYDGKGGYAKSSLKVSVGSGGPTFSGIVSSTDSPVLAGAVVDVNGSVAVTDAAGFFRLRVPDRKRFVLTIRKPGYAFVSRIYYDGVSGGQWRLARASVFRVDPAQPIDVQNRRTVRDCPGAASGRLDWRSHPALADAQFQDGRGNVVAPPADAKRLPGLPGEAANQPPRRDGCGPGVRVRIPADSLVDAAGRAPAGPVDVQVSTIDLDTGDQMPGDYTVQTAAGQTRVMQPYGAGIIEISARGQRYDLRAGASAELVIPVDAAQLRAGGALPSTMPLLTYDEPRGVWREDGQLTLQTVAGAAAYVAKVNHFTAYNADNIKTDQACIAVQNQGMPASYDLELTIPQAGGAAPEKRHFSGVTGGNTEIALINLPSSTNIVLVPIRASGPNASLPMGVFVVNSGAPQNPAWPTVPGGFSNEPQGPPYYHETAGQPDGACSTRVVLQDLGLKFYPDPTVGAFLHGLNTFAAVNLSETDVAFPDEVALRDAVRAASQQYRAQIDPRGLRPTLSCFKLVNRMPLKPGETCPQHAAVGFSPQAALSETRAVYANTVDLGFGREMHCVRDGAKVACYVSNYDSLVYTGPGQAPDLSKAQGAADGLNGLRQPDATVAMEFSQIEDALPAGGALDAPIMFSDATAVVKFYVFDAVGIPVDEANLDGLGSRPVPQLCMVCHGGLIPPSAGTPFTPVFGSRDSVKLGARFLPFDLRGLTLLPTGPFSRASQEDAFRALNAMARQAPPADPTSGAIGALIDAWYPGGTGPQQSDAVVPLWNDPTDVRRALHRQVYRDVLARGCRTCHVANPFAGTRFEKPLDLDNRLGTVQFLVCRQHVMPHARRTHDLFWTSIGPSQPAGLQTYGDTVHTGGWQRVGDSGVSDDLLCGQEYRQGGGPTVPPTQFTPVENVFSGNCVGCHNAMNAVSGGVAGLNLEPPGARERLVGVAAAELPGWLRVQGGKNTETTSYLWHKLAGTHGSLAMPGGFVAPGPGNQMPPFDALTPADLDVVRSWIRGGAQP